MLRRERTDQLPGLVEREILADRTDRSGRVGILMLGVNEWNIKELSLIHI